MKKHLTSFALLVSLTALQAQTGSNPQLTLGEVILSNIGSPWGMDFVNNNEVLFTEKGGKLFRCNISGKTTTQITGLPAITQNGQGGLLDVALHPDFATNKYVYLTYAVADGGGQTTALGRGVLNNNQLENFTELFRALPIVNSGVHFGSRIAFDKDNFVYLSVGDRGTPSNAQNLNIHAGKIMRLKDNGDVPSDNPLVGQANTRPEIFSWGHRNVQGMAMHPISGQIYAHEHGPRGGDELNLIKKGANYGWPTVTFGINYDGSKITDDTIGPGIEPPITYWVPSIAPAGLAFLQSTQAGNDGDVLLGALAGTHVQWLTLKNNKVNQATRSMDGYARFRDVGQAPDGKIYALTESPNRLIRLNSNVVVTSLENVETESAETYIFPNPAAGDAQVQIRLTQATRVTIKIFNSENRLFSTPLSAQYLENGTHHISLPKETVAGVYYVEITKDKSKSVLRWIKL